MNSDNHQGIYEKDFYPRKDELYTFHISSKNTLQVFLWFSNIIKLVMFFELSYRTELSSNT